ncbi:MAG: right-handed parallel beta-helix repeat-containing protein [Verrucomicrobia bacterium]|nr:right-handed parallel beta-helix repeat-containing protein [Verrucomicrobiota bacterium]
MYLKPRSLFFLLLGLSSAHAAAPLAPPPQPPAALIQSKGNTTYTIDPVKGDDKNPAGRPWKTYGALNRVRLAPGDTVIIAPGTQEETLQPSGAGTEDKPIVIRFLPGTHTIGGQNIVRRPLFVSNSQDSTDPKPIGIIIENMKHVRVEGGGVEGPGKTLILFDGRMVQIFNHQSEDITFNRLVLDLKRPTVSEFRALEVGPTHAVIQVAEQSDYEVKDGKFTWTGDWGPGSFCQEAIPAEGRAWRSRTPFGWNANGQTAATATDLGERKVRLDYSTKEPGLTAGHQYHFRNTKREMVGVHIARSARITFRDCDIYALTGMGVVSQFTDTLTFQRVNVAPPKNTLRTCPAWADIFQFSNCKGEILVDSCRLSGMQDDAINCHGTYLHIVDQIGTDQLLVRYVHRQTYGFAPYTAGDEIAVMNPATIREYPNNPRARVASVERISDKVWLVRLDAPAPRFEPNDVLDNITWNPNITVLNNHVDMDPVRGFLFATRGKIRVEGNHLDKCAHPGILIEGDATHWMESSPVRDLLIKNNRFVACGIVIAAAIKVNDPKAPVHENVRIVGNTFERGEIKVKSVKGLVVTDNTSTPDALRVTVDPSCSEVVIEKNTIAE